MDILSELLLSTELQELYLQNKEWMSQTLFLEDESRFFQKLLNKNHTTEQIDLIRESLTSLKERTIELRNLVLKHQQLLESILKDPEQTIGLELIEEHAAITAEIQQLFYSDRLLKTELFAMVEGN